MIKALFITTNVSLAVVISWMAYQRGKANGRMEMLKELLQERLDLIKCSGSNPMFTGEFLKE